MSSPLVPAIAVDERWQGSHGIGRFSSEVIAAVPGLIPLQLGGSPSAPLDTFRLSHALRGRRPDLFFTPGYNCPVNAPCPFVVTVHDLAHIQLPGMSLLKGAYYKLVMRPALRRAAAVLTVSDYFRQEIARWAGIDESKIVNVGNGISAEFTVHGEVERRHRPYFLHVGNQRPHKNLERMLAAFVSSGLGQCMDVICTGEASAETLNMIQRLNVEQQVYFTGRVDDRRLAALYRGATALLFASLYEGFGIPIVEAMACGVPVITSNITAMPEVAGDAALLVDPRDLSGISEAMRRVVSDAGLAGRLRAAGLLRSRRYSWAATAGRVGAVLSALTVGGSLPSSAASEP